MLTNPNVPVKVSVVAAMCSGTRLRRNMLLNEDGNQLVRPLVGSPAVMAFTNSDLSWHPHA